MEHDERVEAAERELGALLRAVGDDDLRVAVPTCPGWTVLDLAHHVGEFLGFWAHVLCEGTGREKTDHAPPPDADVTPAWLSAAGADMVDQLRHTPAATPVWTWFEPDQTAGFVARRIASELAIHRYDAQSARGTCTPIDAALAIEGIDETLEALVTTRPRTGVPTGQTMHLHGTDEGLAPGLGAEWLVTLLPDRIDVTRTHAKGDLALRGAVSDLELLLYNRPPLGPIESFGDASVIDLWYGEFVF
ncbi:MAG TPA: maleylpyruvate isomerase family mycothiol-dependent enzyme [Acidimicrobiales bacterium]|nr:maleylpyruvate isomerase family mycothiol-dependent enzyme [Acidimicrobiales bacterium]